MTRVTQGASGVRSVEREGISLIHRVQSLRHSCHPVSRLQRRQLDSEARALERAVITLRGQQ
jgi:hypothetical protein